MRRKSAACPMLASGAIGARPSRRRAIAATNAGTAATDNDEGHGTDDGTPFQFTSPAILCPVRPSAPSPMWRVTQQLMLPECRFSGCGVRAANCRNWQSNCHVLAPGERRLGALAVESIAHGCDLLRCIPAHDELNELLVDTK